jgi:hypothetical protein
MARAMPVIFFGVGSDFEADKDYGTDGINGTDGNF